MLIDGITLTSTSSIQNLTVGTGTSEPTVHAEGSLFFNTATDTLEYFDGNAWVAVLTGSGSYVPTTSINAANGVAGLDASSKIALTQIPTLTSSYVTGVVPTTSVNTANGVAGLDSTGKIPSSLLPSIAIIDTYVVASQAAMLALNAQRGDVAIRSDVNKTFILSTDTPSNVGDWLQILAPGSVQSVAGKTGIVTLAASDLTSFSTVPYDIAFSIYGKPSTAEQVFRFRACRAYTLPSVQTGAQAIATTAATGSTVFTLTKNSTSFGTVTFAANATSGTISISSPVTFAVGDLLVITAPASADATLADIDFSFIATLS